MTQPQQVVGQGPTPFTFLVGEARTGDGQVLNMVEIHSITGMQRYFAAPEEAEKLAAHWLQGTRQQRTGLVVPTPGQFPVASPANGRPAIG